MKPQAKKTAAKTATKVASKKAASFKKGDTVLFLGWDGAEPDYKEDDDRIEEGMVGKVLTVGADETEVSFEVNGNSTVVGLIDTEIRIATKAEIAAAIASEEEDEDEDEDESEEEADATYEDQSVAELRTECVARGLAKGGSHAALVARLEENDIAPEEEEEEADEEEEAVEPAKGAKGKREAKAEEKPVKEKSLGRLADEGDKKAIRELSKRADKVELDPEDSENGETWTQFERTLKAVEKEANRPALTITKSVTQEISDDGDNAIAAAKRLMETSEKTGYTLGGVLAVISRQKLYETLKVKGEFPYAGHKGFEAFCVEYLNCRYRKAQYLIGIYEAFTNAGLTEAKIGSIGWTKARELVSILNAEPESAETWLELAKTSSTEEVADAVKARLTKIGAKQHGNTKTVRSVVCRFTVHADEGKVIEEALAMAKEQADTDDDSKAFAYIVKEWMTFQS